MSLAFHLGFTALVAAVAVQRLLELRKSARHEAALRARGAIEHAPGQMPWMRALHAMWLISTLLESWWREPPPVALSLAALAVLVIGQALRWIAMRTLGERWTVKIITLPGAPPIRSGVFAHLRHPNYLGVVLEIAALPMIAGAVITAVTFSIANALLLRARIEAEERALVGALDERGARSSGVLPHG